MDTHDQFERMNRLFQRKLQAERDKERDRAMISRSEIVEEGKAMGLTDEESITLAQFVLDRNWRRLPGPPPSEQRGFMGAAFTDALGYQRLFGG